MNDIIVKNQPVLSRVLSCINSKNVGVQAYILVGDNDDKLKEYSILFSKVVICPNKYENKCTKCNVCKRIESGNYGELKVINPVGNVIKKENILDLRESFQTNSIEGRNQVYIINHAEALNSAAANSLLKFLEEPDSNTVAIFTTNNIDTVVKTVVSRCQIIKLNNFESSSAEEVISNLCGLVNEKQSIVMNFYLALENNPAKAYTAEKNAFLGVFSTKEDIKSALNMLLLMYKDTMNYKLFNKMEYFNNEIAIKNAAESNKIDQITKKIKFLLENINKLEYNVNVSLFINNLIIGIGDI